MMDSTTTLKYEQQQAMRQAEVKIAEIEEKIITQ